MIHTHHCFPSSVPNPNQNPHTAVYGGANPNLRLLSSNSKHTMASSPADCDVSDTRPSLSVLNNRIRNLKKKLNRISQLEDSISQGKSLKNKEQEDLLKSKPSILFAVDELEKLRQPLTAAVEEEINLAIKHRQVVAENNENESDGVRVSKSKTLGSENDVVPTVIEDLLKLIYFGSMFDVKAQSEFNSVMLTRIHERNCCLTYDYVTDDDNAVMLGENDLDLISVMSSLLISRPVDSSLSHANAVQRCIEHAKLWIEKSDQAIDLNSTVTYAALREKLDKIVGSDFYKITPEMKAPAVVAAEAAGNYAFHVPVESTVTAHERKEEPATDFQRNETHEDQSSPVEDSPKHEQEAENLTENEVHVEQVETPAGGTEYKEQYVPRRSYNQRGNGRSGGGVGRGGGRGYGNGRGGRSGGRAGPYQNRRDQYFEQPGNYYPRNNYYGGRGRGGRGNRGGGSNGYNHHNASGGEVAMS